MSLDKFYAEGRCELYITIAATFPAGVLIIPLFASVSFNLFYTLVLAAFINLFAQFALLLVFTFYRKFSRHSWVNS